jgi:integrase/recombinase XerD
MKPSIKTVILSRPNADGRHTVYLRVTHRRRSKYFAVGLCDAAQWDDEKCRLRKNYPSAAKYNDLLREYESRASSAIVEMDRAGQAFSFDRVKAAVFVQAARSAVTVSDFLRSAAAGMSYGNAEAYKWTAKALDGFRPGVEFTDVTPDFLRSFERWLRQTRGIENTSISMYMRTIRAAYNRAIKTGAAHASQYPFVAYSIGHLKQVVKPRAVSIAVVRQIEAMPAELATDLFLFSFYTRGMALIDVAYLKPGNIANGRVEYTRRKTGRAYSIALNEKAAAILLRYSGGVYCFQVLKGDEASEVKERNRIKRCQSVTNFRLRDICEALNVPHRVSFYSARHTYAMELRRVGVSSEVISEALGHSDPRITKAYLRRFEDSVLDAADRLLLSPAP